MRCEVSRRWRLLFQWASTAWQHVGIPMCVSCKNTLTQPPHPLKSRGLIRQSGAVVHYVTLLPTRFCWLLAHQPESNSTRKTISCLVSCRIEALNGPTMGAAVAKVSFLKKKKRNKTKTKLIVGHTFAEMAYNGRQLLRDVWQRPMTDWKEKRGKECIDFFFKKKDYFYCLTKTSSCH